MKKITAVFRRKFDLSLAKYQLCVFIYSCFFSLTVFAQNQLDIQGSPTSLDTVVKIRVNYSEGQPVDVVALKAYSEPLPGRGIGGWFYGGLNGIIAVARNGHAVRGTSQTTAIKGYGINGHGLEGTSSYASAIYGFSSNEIGVEGVSTRSYGIYGSSTDSAGVFGKSINWHGVIGKSLNDYGVFGESTNDIGIFGKSQGNVGVYGTSVTNIGVYGFAPVGIVGFGTTSDFDARGPGANYAATSSRRWKKNINNISDPLNMIAKLRGVYFDWDQEHGGKFDIGFIAEEVGAVIPEIVVFEENGIDASGMDYSKMTPLLVEAINAMRREYQSLIQDQTNKIQDQSNKIIAL